MDRESAAAAAAGPLRAQSLEAIKGVQWIPAWGEERIHNMLANRPDWCISRQRSWGVPIPARRLPGLPARAADAGAHRARRRRLRRPRRRRLVRAAARGVPARRAPPARRAAARRSTARPTSSTSGSTRARATRRCSAPNPALTLAGGRLPRRQRSVSRLVPQLAARRPRHAAAGALRARHHPRLRRRRATAARCRSRSATRSCRRTSSSSTAPRSSGCGRRWSTTARKCGCSKEILARVVEAYRKLRNTLRYLAVEPLRLRSGRATWWPMERMQEVDRYALARYAEAATAGPRGLRRLRLPGHRAQR